jgi:hypothetical protein
MVTETRFPKSPPITVNGQSGAQLTTGYGTSEVEWIVETDNVLQDISYRSNIYKVAADGTLTPISLGVALVTHLTTDGSPVVKSASYNVPQTSLNPTDAILWRIEHYKPSRGTWVEEYANYRQFITPQLNATSLDSITAYLYYKLQRVQIDTLYYWSLLFGYATITTRWYNFAYTPYVPPPTVKKAIMDGFVFIE